MSQWPSSTVAIECPCRVIVVIAAGAPQRKQWMLEVAHHVQSRQAGFEFEHCHESPPESRRGGMPPP